MHHIPEHINQDIKRRSEKIRTKQLLQMDTGAKEIQQKTIFLSMHLIR